MTICFRKFDRKRHPALEFGFASFISFGVGGKEEKKIVDAEICGN